MKRTASHLLDKLLEKAVSRRLTVFVIATILEFTEKNISDGWILVACIYLFSLTALQLAELYFGRPNASGGKQTPGLVPADQELP
jgi:hypothetical protein